MAAASFSRPCWGPKSRTTRSQVESMNWNRPVAEEVLAFTVGAKADSLSAMDIRSVGSVSVLRAARTTVSTSSRLIRMGPNCIMAELAPGARLITGLPGSASCSGRRRAQVMAAWSRSPSWSQEIGMRTASRDGMVRGDRVRGVVEAKVGLLAATSRGGCAFCDRIAPPVSRASATGAAAMRRSLPRSF